MSFSLSRLLNLCMTNRYWLACLPLLIVMISSTLYGNFGNHDFWEHSAVVKELATHPLSPQHPLFNVNKPHVFFSPYLLAVGLLAKLGSLTSTNALAIAGIGNLLLLLISLRLFIYGFFEKYQDAIAFYALIFVLFLWPVNVWNWSGFIHFKFLGHGLPFPSTFAIATTFLIFPLYRRALDTSDNTLFMLTGLLLTVVLLTHPPTAVVTCIGIFVISLHFFNMIGLPALLPGFLLGLGAIALALLWPYYSFYDLMPFTGSGKSNQEVSSLVMYEKVLRVWPTVILFPIAVPLLIARFKANKFDGLGLMLSGVVLAYILGYFMGHFMGLYVFGRTISFIAIFMQIALAAKLAQLEAEAWSGKLFPSIPIILLIGVTLVTVALNTSNKNVLSQSLKGIQGMKHSYKDYEVLGRYVDQYAVVLSDINTSWKIPTFAGKTIASKHPVAYVDDHNIRRNDQKKFFSNEAKDREKQSILDRYRVNYIFINKKRTGVANDYIRFGDLIYENTNFLLIKTSLNDQKDSSNIQ